MEICDSFSVLSGHPALQVLFLRQSNEREKAASHSLHQEVISYCFGRLLPVTWFDSAVLYKKP